MKLRSPVRALALLVLVSSSTLAADAPAPAAATPRPAAIEPTAANVPYGPHERQVLDFYQAKSDQPTPLLFFIHGGGWTTGDKKNPGGLSACLKAGISVVSINYRYNWQAQLDGVYPPVSAPLHDAARALQFVRSKAKEWNLDKTRVCASGGSAGACSSIWLAYHDDLADPKSADPIARESTRLWCAAVNGAQTSLDPKQLVEWTPNSRYGGHAFGYEDPNDIKTRDKFFAEFAAHREELLPLIKEYSPYGLVTRDDPPVYYTYNAPPGLGQDQKDPTHTSNYGVKMQEHCREIGVASELVYPGAPEVKHPNMESYILDALKAPTAEAVTGK